MRKVIIIGSGPAGYTAAVYAARANLAPLMLTGLQAGGQLTLTTLVENYPGFVDGIQGPELMETMKKQAERFGTEMIAEDATSVDFQRRPFGVGAGDASYESQPVIIATGATAKLLGLDAERNLMAGARDGRPAAGDFVANAHQPQAQTFREQIALQRDGDITVAPGTIHAGVPGVFDAGDAQDHI